LAIGSYAIAYHLKENTRGRKETLTETVRAANFDRDAVLPLPHPSPRNLMWLKRNAWFEAECIPKLRRRVAKLLASG
jgi:uracil-DNA glycosylase